MSDEEFGKFVSSKPLVFWPSVFALLGALGYLIRKMKFSGHRDSWHLESRYIL